MDKANPGSAVGVDETAGTAASKPMGAAAPEPRSALYSFMVPLICKDCDKQFEVPYRHFQVGVVFHCPHCRGSFVPTTPIYRAVRDAFERFISTRDRAPEDHARRSQSPADLERKDEIELANFRARLLELARSMRPAGKMVKRKGWGAMFT